MKKAIYALDQFDVIFGKDDRKEIAGMVDVYAPPQSSRILLENPRLLAEVEILLSGKGCVKIDTEFLEAAPRLEAVFFACGTVQVVESDDFWRRGIVLSSAHDIQAIPVAEYSMAQIILCLKRVYQSAVLSRKRPPESLPFEKQLGSCGTKVGLISLGAVARHVTRLLESLEVKVLAYDPFFEQDKAERLGIELVSLEEIFARSEVVSLHTPLLEETRGMITGDHFRLMRENASFINTARGALVRENEMIQVLRERPDIFAVLDVTSPEPPEDDSPLWTLSNVFMTPHVSGSRGREGLRLGHFVVEELRRYLNGEPLKGCFKRDMMRIMS